MKSAMGYCKRLERSVNYLSLIKLIVSTFLVYKVKKCLLCFGSKV